MWTGWEWEVMGWCVLIKGWWHCSLVGRFHEWSGLERLSMASHSGVSYYCFSTKAGSVVTVVSKWVGNGKPKCMRCFSLAFHESAPSFWIMGFAHLYVKCVCVCVAGRGSGWSILLYVWLYDQGFLHWNLKEAFPLNLGKSTDLITAYYSTKRH